MSDFPDQIDYEDHLQLYKHMMLGVNAENDLHFEQEAQDMHSGVVNDAVMKVMMEVVNVIPAITNPDARDYAQYGVLRRLNMIWSGLRGIRSIVPSNRTAPLTLKQSSEIDNKINALYINIIGAVDNVAWVLREEIGTDQTKQLPRTAIGIDNDRFLRDENFGSVREAMAPLRKWLKETKERRNPAAHRIPLSVPPAEVTHDQAQQRLRLERELLMCLDQERREALHKRINSIGRFVPIFAHKPDEIAFPLYPTIPQDVANLLKVVRMGFKLLKKPTGDL